MYSFLITKNDGTKEAFREEKLISSLKHSGASRAEIDKILEIISNRITDDITSDEIFKLAFDHLKKGHQKPAAKYSLRRSVLSLGPTGFPFELYISKLLEVQGFRTEVGQVLIGNCVDHEIDIVAWNNKDLILIEAKFHNDLQTKTDTKVALYIKARFDDLKDKEFSFGDVKMKPTRSLIITNTKFTDNAIKYANCAGLELIGWDFPKDGNLYQLIENSGIYPVTSFSTLTKEQKVELIKRNVIDCNSIKGKEKILNEIGVHGSKAKKILDEINSVCNID